MLSPTRSCLPLLLPPILQMGLQSSSAVVATFLFVVSTFAAGGVPCRHTHTCTLQLNPGSSAPVAKPPFMLLPLGWVSANPPPCLPADRPPPSGASPTPPPAAMGAMSLAVTVGSSSAGTASLIMNIVLLIGVVVSGGLLLRCGGFGLLFSSVAAVRAAAFCCG